MVFFLLETNKRKNVTIGVSFARSNASFTLENHFHWSDFHRRRKIFHQTPAHGRREIGKTFPSPYTVVWDEFVNKFKFSSSSWLGVNSQEAFLGGIVSEKAYSFGFGEGTFLQKNMYHKKALFSFKRTASNIGRKKTLTSQLTKEEKWRLIHVKRVFQHSLKNKNETMLKWEMFVVCFRSIVTPSSIFRCHQWRKWILGNIFVSKNGNERTFVIIESRKNACKRQRQMVDRKKCNK